MRDGGLEILAPAGGEEQLQAAVRAGADAVYLGMRRFNARRGARNFDEEGLRGAVSYCHARGVDVHVALNTLLLDGELEAALNELASIARCGADAVIVQDLGVARLVRARCPDLPLHASTQLAVHNAAGARLLEGLGFTRVVLARELTLAEIETICASTALEVEVFVHGALCMCVSGCCYLSAMLGGRSGNRGRCAQPCRLPFTANGREYALSLKDMSHLAQLAALRRAGVCSVKIEGRMKRPEYVAAAVQACRAARAGEEYDAQRLRDAFSRSGFTDGYLTGRRTLAMFGHRTREDVAATQSAAALPRGEFAGVPVSMSVVVQDKAPVRLEVTDGARTVCVSGEPPETAQNRPADEQSVRQSLAKTGGTPFYLERLTAQIGRGLAVRGGALNALRREALARLLEARAQFVPKAFAAGPLSPKAAHLPCAVPAVRLRAQRVEQIPPGADAQRIILPLEEILREPRCVERFGDALVAEIPALVFPAREETVRAQLERIRGLGVRRALCENPGAIALAKDACLRPLGGHGLNPLNSEALEALEKLGVEDVTVSFELSLEKIRALGGAGHSRLRLSAAHADARLPHAGAERLRRLRRRAPPARPKGDRVHGAV